MYKFTALFLTAIALLTGGCATTTKSRVTEIAHNPPPSERFADFNHFVILPIAMKAPYAGQEGNEAAKIKIQENLDLRLDSTLAAWNKLGATATTPHSLQIVPEITEIKFINGTARFWAGALAGSSMVVIKVRFIDAETSKLIAEPEFYSHAAAMAGAFSIGGADNAMLVRIANRVADYVTGNYEQAVGGATGAEVQ